jgi:phosphoribosylanthranilate isomerase
VFVKICGITNEDDALLAVALGADAVGFVFAPSPRQIAPQQVYDITRRLPPEILTVGVFRDETPGRVVEICQSAGVRGAQLHGHETPADVAAVSQHVPWVIKSVVAGSVDAARADTFGTRAVLVDAPSPGSGRVFDWGILMEMPEVERLILAGGLTPENVASAIATVRPWGVDVASGVETAPGRKDPVAMRRFIEAARDAAPPEHVPPGTAPYDWGDE